MVLILRPADAPHLAGGPGDLPQAAERALAVADALTRLGEQADPGRVAEEVKARQGIDLQPEEVEVTRAALLESFPTSDRVVRRCGRARLDVGPRAGRRPERAVHALRRFRTPGSGGGPA